MSILRAVISICEEHGLHYYLVGGTLLGAVRHSGFIPWDDDIDIALPRPDFEKLGTLCRRFLPEHNTYISYKDDCRIPNNIVKVFDNRTVLIEEAEERLQVKLGVYIDIFPFDGVPSSHLGKAFHYRMVYLLRSLMTLNSTVLSPRRALYKRILIRIIKSFMDERCLAVIHRCLDGLLMRYDFSSSEEVCNYLGAYGNREICPKSWLGEGSTLSFEGLLLNGVQEYGKYLERIYGDYLTLPPFEQRKSHHRYQACYWRQTAGTSAICGTDGVEIGVPAQQEASTHGSAQTQSH